MNRYINILSISFTAFCLSCNKSELSRQMIPVPNGDFEYWTSALVLMDWKSNSCPMCMTPIDMYVVQKITDAANGQYAAKLTFNAHNRSMVFNKFSVSAHPGALECYVKSVIESGDTAKVHIDLFSGHHIIDSGEWLETTSSGTYRKIIIPISQHSPSADSAYIKITGGGKANTNLYIDNMVFVK